MLISNRFIPSFNSNCDEFNTMRTIYTTKYKMQGYIVIKIYNIQTYQLSDKVYP